ncbi:hypothetical protein GGQ71_004754 [Rhizobium taibaishanense]|uniref:Uncharacterized protein n=1 Tax=Allorhizobium taibaishanense TaxID=887144 RepID=A0A7W6HSN2_9HYPH|nr:hypothetical protein [Allorhizobium taibaishanense]
MRGRALRVVADGVVAFVGDGEGAEEATGYGKIKGRTSRLGRSVVLVGDFGHLCTSSMLDAMCWHPNLCRIINDNRTSHRNF